MSPMNSVLKALAADLTPPQLELLGDPSRTGPGPLARTVVERGWMDEERVCRRLAAHFQREWLHLPEGPIPSELVALVPPAVAMEHLVLPVGVVPPNREEVVVAAAQPLPHRLWESLLRASPRKLRLVLAPVGQLQARIAQIFGGTEGLPWELPVRPPEGPHPFAETQIQAPVGLERTGVLAVSEEESSPFSPELEGASQTSPGSSDIPFSESEAEARRWVHPEPPFGPILQAPRAQAWLEQTGPSEADPKVLRAVVRQLLEREIWSWQRLEALLTDGDD